MSAARERVVVGFDGSAESLAALRWAIGEARHRQADVDVITRWYPPLVAEASGYQVGFVMDDELSAGARQALAAALASVEADIQDATAEGRSFAGRRPRGRARTHPRERVQGRNGDRDRTSGTRRPQPAPARLGQPPRRRPCRVPSGRCPGSAAQ